MRARDGSISSLGMRSQSQLIAVLCYQIIQGPILGVRDKVKPGGIDMNGLFALLLGLSLRTVLGRNPDFARYAFRNSANEYGRLLDDERPYEGTKSFVRVLGASSRASRIEINDKVAQTRDITS